MPISERYQDSLIARLKNPNYAAGYLDVCWQKMSQMLNYFIWC